MTSIATYLLVSILLGVAATAGGAAQEEPTPGDAGEPSDAFVAVTERLAQERGSLGRRTGSEAARPRRASDTESVILVS